MPAFKFDSGAASNEALRTAIAVIPDLDIVVGILAAADTAKLAFPLKTAKPLQELLGKRSVRVGNHLISQKAIEAYMSDQFPIESKLGLAKAAYLALCRCNVETAWVLSAPADAKRLLAELDEFKRSAKEGGK